MNLSSNSNSAEGGGSLISRTKHVIYSSWSHILSRLFVSKPEFLPCTPDGCGQMHRHIQIIEDENCYLLAILNIVKDVLSHTWPSL